MQCSGLLRFRRDTGLCMGVQVLYPPQSILKLIHPIDLICTSLYAHLQCSGLLTCMYVCEYYKYNGGATCVPTVTLSDDFNDVCDIVC